MTITLTKKQKDMVLSYIYCVMAEDDRHPSDVVNDELGLYKGDWDKYIQDMIGWHSINFCASCGKMKEPRHEFFVNCDCPAS
mgnify:CR=1 FL=1